MKCERCSRKAVIELRYASKAYCERHFVDYYEKRVKRTITKNKMLRRNEKIAVGVSGGKDSMCMLYLLHKMGYNIEAILIDEGIKGYRNKTIPYVEKLCKKLKVPLHIYSFKKEFKNTVDDIVKKKPGLSCSYCGVLRRRLLNNAARDIHADKLAIGHNLDDEAQMILMNLFRSELIRLARAGPVVGLVDNKKFVHRAKPLRECLERENVAYALINGIEYDDIECPYAKDAYRNSVREALNTLEEKQPGAKIGCLHSFDKIMPILREHFEDSGTPNECVKCGELTSGNICKACQMLDEL